MVFEPSGCFSLQLFWLVTTHKINRFYKKPTENKTFKINSPTEDDSLFRLISLITPLPDLEEFVLVEKAKWDFVAAVLASFESLKCHIEYRSKGPNLTQ